MPYRIHNQEKEQFIKLFKHDRIDRFEERFALLEVFLQTEKHITDQELVQLLREAGWTMDPDFVSETLQLMCEYGFAVKNRFDNGDFRYEHHHLGQHHDHMICTKCGEIIEFEDSTLEKLQTSIAKQHGFHVLQHRMELYGICERCLKARSTTISLSMARQGEKLLIKAFSGGAKSHMRLLSMGLRIGDRVDLITNMNHGQIVIALDYKRLVIGRGLAGKVLVQPIGDEQ